MRARLDKRIIIPVSRTNDENAAASRGSACVFIFNNVGAAGVYCVAAPALGITSVITSQFFSKRLRDAATMRYVITDIEFSQDAFSINSNEKTQTCPKIAYPTTIPTGNAILVPNVNSPSGIQMAIV